MLGGKSHCIVSSNPRSYPCRRTLLTSHVLWGFYARHLYEFYRRLGKWVITGTLTGDSTFGRCLCHAFHGGGRLTLRKLIRGTSYLGLGGLLGAVAFGLIATITPAHGLRVLWNMKIYWFEDAVILELHPIELIKSFPYGKLNEPKPTSISFTAPVSYQE